MSSASRGQRSRFRDKSNIVYRYEDGVRRAMNQPAADVIQEVNPNDPEVRKFLGVNVESEFSNPLPALPVPAGADSYDDCGDEQPLLFCSKCGKPIGVNRRCGRLQCRECWHSGVKRTAVSIASSIEGRKRYENTAHRAVHGEGYGTLRHHGVVSPPPGFWMRRNDPLSASVEIVKLLLGEFGADEGAIVYHPWRIKVEYRGDVLGHDSGEGDLQWKHILSLIQRVGWEPVRDKLLIFNPHFHCFVLSDHFFGESEYIEEKSGWVVHRIADDDGASIRSLPDLCSAVGYSLSHVGLKETERGMDAAYWMFGETHNWEPTDGVRADVDKCFRAVAPEVLGEEFPDLRCSQADESDNQGASIATGSIDGSLDGLDDELDDACRGVFVSMRKAPQYLKNGDWCDGAPHTDALRLKYNEYKLLHIDRPPPDMDLPPMG